MYDIAIIGAGPAGATLARLLGTSYRILLIEKKLVMPSQGREPGAKCCGGLLAPDAQRMLAVMGLGLPEQILTGPQLFAVRAIDIPNQIERYYQRPYLNIDRGKFDQWLVSLIPPTVEIRESCFFRSLELDSNGVTINLAHSGTMISERAKIVVGADGAFSLVRKQAFPRHRSPRSYVAIQEVHHVATMHPYFTVLFDSEITDFYSWIIPKKDVVIIGSALAPGETATAKFEHFKTKLRELGYEFGDSGARDGALLLRPLRTAHLCTGNNKIALVGEAAGWISPSSAEGISYAFRSAVALADALAPGIERFDKRYHRKAAPLRKNIRRKNRKAQFMYRPFLRRLVMKSGYRSINVRMS